MKKKSNYKIIDLVGRGQFGKVFAAVDRSCGTLVALKELKPKQLPTNSFLRELNFLVTLNHFNIVTCKALEHWQDNRYIVMEYCEGGTLRTLLNNSGQLSLEQSLKLVIDLLSGLEYAHQRGIIHRDIKPENILLKISDRSWTAHIADFGIAKLQPQNEPGIIGNTGSPAYMAPEQFYGRYSYSCDLYGVGIILYELVVGKRPFSGMPRELLSAHLSQPVNIPQNLPLLLRSAIAKSLQKMPQRRFQDAKSMRESLELVRATLTIIPYTLPSQEYLISRIIPVSKLTLPEPVTHLGATGKQIYASNGDRLWLLRHKAPRSLSMELDGTINSFQFTARGCFICTFASVYYLPQDITSNDFRLVSQTLLPILSFPTNSLVCTIDPDGFWLGVFYLPNRSETPIFEIYNLPNSGLQRSLGQFRKQSNRRQWNHLIALNCRYGLGIYQNRARNTELHLFDRHGNWLANFTVRFALEQIYYDPFVSELILATEANNPGVAVLIWLKKFRIERLDLDLVPMAIASCSQGYLLCDCWGKIALVTREDLNVRYYQIPLPKGFKVTAIVGFNTQLLVAAAGSSSLLQKFSLDCSSER